MKWHVKDRYFQYRQKKLIKNTSIKLYKSLLQCLKETPVSFKHNGYKDFWCIQWHGGITVNGKVKKPPQDIFLRGFQWVGLFNYKQ